MFVRTFTAGAIIAAAALAPPAQAQANCAMRDSIIERLETRYGEALTGGGLRNEMQVVEVWASAKTGTWTVLVTRADGIACIMASGTNWHETEPMSAKAGVKS